MVLSQTQNPQFSQSSPGSSIDDPGNSKQDAINIDSDKDEDEQETSDPDQSRALDEAKLSPTESASKVLEDSNQQEKQTNNSQLSNKEVERKRPHNVSMTQPAAFDRFFMPSSDLCASINDHLTSMQSAMKTD